MILVFILSVFLVPFFTWNRPTTIQLNLGNPLSDLPHNTFPIKQPLRDVVSYTNTVVIIIITIHFTRWRTLITKFKFIKNARKV